MCVQENNQDQFLPNFFGSIFGELRLWWGFIFLFNISYSNSSGDVGAEKWFIEECADPSLNLIVPIFSFAKGIDSVEELLEIFASLSHIIYSLWFIEGPDDVECSLALT